MYCNDLCKTAWHNHNRTLTPNAIYDCEICGKHVEKWVSPARVKSGECSNRFCSRTCAGVWRKGKNHPLWKGGRQIDKDGYVMVYMPDHHEANYKGLVREHRLVMEEKLGRKLKKAEVVHHKRKSFPADNRPSNLQLFSSHAEHMRHETTSFKRKRNGTWKKKS